LQVTTGRGRTKVFSWSWTYV